MNILELFAHIGLKADTTQANSFLKGVNGIKTALVGAVAGSLSFAGAIKGINDAMQNAMQLKNFAAQTGASTTELQKWRAVADQVSGSGSAVAESIKAIVANQNKIKLGQGNISGYQLLGINPNQDPFEVLKQLREKTANLSAGMRRNIMGQFGVSSELTATLELTNKQFDQMAKRAWAISPSMINGMNKARASMEQVKNAVTYFTAELATKLAPVIERVSQFVIKLVDFFVKGVENIDKLIQGTIGWRAALTALVAVLAVMNAEFLLSPIGLFTAAIILLMGLLQDIGDYNSGKKSFIGYIMERFPAVSGPMKTLLELLTGIGAIIKSVFSGNMSGFDETIKKWKEWGGILATIADLLERIKNFFESKAGKEMTGGVGTMASEIGKGNLVSNSWSKPSVATGIEKFGIGAVRAIFGDKFAEDLNRRITGGGTTVYNINGNSAEDAARAAKILQQQQNNQTASQGARTGREASTTPQTYAGAPFTP